MQEYKKGIVSLIVPCYNGDEYIDRFFQSLLLQKYTKLQVIVINDGSTDSSAEKIMSYEAKMKMLNMELCYYAKDNGGLGSAVALGLQKVCGEYFTWFNIDDILLPETISVMKNFLDSNEEFGLVRPDVYISKEDSPYKAYCCINDNNAEKNNSKLFYYALIEKNFTFGCSMLRTEWFDKINPSRYIYESRQGQNWQILLPMLYYYKSGYIDMPLYYVVEQKESTSRVSDPIKRIKQLEEYGRIQVKTLEAMDFPEKKECIESVKIRFAHRLFAFCSQSRADYSMLRECYLMLRENNQLTSVEKRRYRHRFFDMEFWLMIKHNILG